jgi:hypothetical protein
VHFKIVRFDSKCKALPANFRKQNLLFYTALDELVPALTARPKRDRADCARSCPDSRQLQVPMSRIFACRRHQFAANVPTKSPIGANRQNRATLHRQKYSKNDDAG